MRCRSIVAAGILACAGCGDQVLGIPRELLVTELDEEDAISLCEEFVALICYDYRGYEYCNGCILYEMCHRVDMIDTMNIQCEDVTVGQVRDCAHQRDFEVCPPSAGGCFFDVALVMCNP